MFLNEDKNKGKEKVGILTRMGDGLLKGGINAVLSNEGLTQQEIMHNLDYVRDAKNPKMLSTICKNKKVITNNLEKGYARYKRFSERPEIKEDRQKSTNVKKILNAYKKAMAAHKVVVKKCDK